MNKSEKLLKKKTVALAMFATAAVSLLAFYGRWTLFIPYAWLSSARPFIWTGVAALTVLLFAVRLIAGGKNSGAFARNAAIVFPFAALIGFFSREVLLGAAAILNSVSSDEARLCVNLESVQRNPRGLFERTQYALLRIEGEGGNVVRELRYMPGSLDMTRLKLGETFELAVDRGPFGYTVRSQQSITRACSVNGNG